MNCHFGQVRASHNNLSSFANVNVLHAISQQALLQATWGCSEVLRDEGVSRALALTFFLGQNHVRGPIDFKAVSAVFLHLQRFGSHMALLTRKIFYDLLLWSAKWHLRLTRGQLTMTRVQLNSSFSTFA